MKKYDAIIIGAGQAGPPLAEKLTQAGRHTAIIERKLFGGTCVNVGCTPTKTLVASARIAHQSRRAAEFGINTGPVSVDMKRIKARMDTIRGESNKGVTAWLTGMDKLDVIHGHACFNGPNEVQVDGETLQADQIFINVGARANVPDMPGLDSVPYLTNSSMLELDQIPEHLVIIGGSYIGLEFAQMYRRFGSKVTVVEKGDRLIGREDPEVSAAILDILTAEGISFELGSTCLSVSASGDRIKVNASCDDGDRVVHGSHLLLAVGRTPNTDELGLAAAGIACSERGQIIVDDELKTNVDGVWALGEVNGRGAFTHTTYNDFEIVAANLLTEEKRRLSDRIDCYGLFVDPPLGRVGMTELAARKAGYKVKVGRRDMSRVARAREFGETLGFIKVIVDADTDKILGASILGLSGDEAIHCIITAMNADLPYQAITHSVHIHPTVSELIPTVFGQLEA